MSKTTCGKHRTDGYALNWKGGVSTLTCRGCGLPESQHETMRETVERLAAMSTIDWTEAGK